MPKNRIKISVFFTDDKREGPLKKKKVCTAVKQVCDGENILQGSVDVIFVDAERIRKLNTRFLKHNYPTDVLAFALQASGECLEGEIYVCSEVAKDQAHEYNIPFEDELMRLVIHGMLHLTGYDDADHALQERMTAKVEYYLQQFFETAAE